MRTQALLAILLAGSTSISCSGPKQPEPSPAPTMGSPAASTAQAADPAPAPALSAVAKAGPLRWEHQAPLVRRAPKSAMRAAEYGVDGDDSAELSVFYFGAGQGGDVESNLQRWVGQLKPRAGDAGGPAVQRSTRTLDGITVYGVEAAGSFGGGMGMPGMAAPTPIDDALLLGAIAEVSTGGAEPERVFFKLVGPRASVERARSAFDALVRSLAKS